MKILLKLLVILSLVSINTACDWLTWNPTYIDEEWVVEKVEYYTKVKMLGIYIKSPQKINEFIFYGDEKLESGFSFSSICSIQTVAVTKEEIFSTIIFNLDIVLNPAVHKTIAFNTTKTFYRVIVQGETSLFKPSVIWRCKFATTSMDITYVDQ